MAEVTICGLNMWHCVLWECAPLKIQTFVYAMTCRFWYFYGLK